MIQDLATHRARAIAHLSEAHEALERAKEELGQALCVLEADDLRLLQREVQRLSAGLSGEGDPLSYARMRPSTSDAVTLLHFPSSAETRFYADKIRASARVSAPPIVGIALSEPLPKDIPEGSPEDIQEALEAAILQPWKLL